MRRRLHTSEHSPSVSVISVLLHSPSRGLLCSALLRHGFGSIFNLIQPRVFSILETVPCSILILNPALCCGILIHPGGCSILILNPALCCGILHHGGRSILRTLNPALCCSILHPGVCSIPILNPALCCSILHPGGCSIFILNHALCWSILHPGACSIV